MKIVILAGGGGTRLWPLSRSSQPKQFSRIMGNSTLFEETVQRFLSHMKPEDIYISTTADLKQKAQQLIPVIPEENYILEPEKRDTAPAMGLVAVYLFNRFPDEPIAYVPSDHYIADKSKFTKIIQLADNLIRETGKMIDIAISPTFPSTVLGYTQIGELHSSSDGIDVYNFLGHTEKPDFEIAKKYLEQGDYLWHASYYMWTPRKILQAFREHSPNHFEQLELIADKFKNNQSIESEFNQMEKISFDYAITEKIDPTQVLIVKGDFGWSDVGAFDVLYEAQKSQVDEKNNLIKGKWIGKNTDNCYIHNDSEKLIATADVDDLAVISTDDVTLVCKKGKAQEVKKIVEKIKQNNWEEYL